MLLLSFKDIRSSVFRPLDLIDSSILTYKRELVNFITFHFELLLEIQKKRHLYKGIMK